MKRTISLILIVLLSILLVVPTTAAPEPPVITLHPQSPNYPQYSTAMYTVKAEGTNLQATWYMEWLGETYNISNTGGPMQPWEGYAGETYGAVQPDAHTFVYFFGGIELDLDGAYIWCVIEDGHYTVTSQKNRISVGNENSPPEIVEFPTTIIVEQGETAEVRCVARSTDGSELSFLWYQTDTAMREDIYAVNRGTETSDYMLCDTSETGTRFYICKVDSANGGITYSSVVSVIVNEKKAEATEPSEPSEPPTPPESAAPSVPAESVAPSAPAESVTPETQTPAGDSTPDTEQKDAFPVWAIVLIAVSAGSISFGVATLFLKKKS